MNIVYDNTCCFAGEVSFFKTNVSKNGLEYPTFLLITKEIFGEKEITTRIPILAFGLNAEKIFKSGLTDGDHIVLTTKAQSGYVKDRPETSGKYNFVVKGIVKINKRKEEGVDAFSSAKDDEDTYSDIPF